MRAGRRRGGRSLTKPDRSRGLTMRNQVAPPSRRHQIIGSVLRKKMRHAAFLPRQYSPSFYWEKSGVIVLIIPDPGLFG